MISAAITAGASREKKKKRGALSEVHGHARNLLPKMDDREGSTDFWYFSWKCQAAITHPEIRVMAAVGIDFVKANQRGTSRNPSGGAVQGMFRNGFCLPLVALRTSENTTE